LNFSVIEPGGIASDFVQNILAQLEASGGMPQDEYLPLFGQYRAAMEQTKWVHSPYQTADEVAHVVVDGVMDAADPPIRRRTSPWAEEICYLKTAADPASSNRISSA
jgi:hypothetical protein